MPRPQTHRSGVFVSYSRADTTLLERLKIFLAPFERAGVFDYWDDSRIEPGMNWREEIRKALDNARVAILLISADFLASEFVRENELPQLLQAAKSGGAVILPVIVGPSAFSKIEGLSDLETVNDPKKPLRKLSGVRRDDVFNELADRVVRALGATGFVAGRPKTKAKAKTTASPASKARTPETTMTSRRGVDYSAYMNRVRDQGQEGSAVGFALAAAIEYQVWKKINTRVEISPRHIYYLARVESGQGIGADTGAHIGDGVKALMRRGAVVEKTWPYKPGEFAKELPEKLKNTKPYKLKESRPLSSAKQIKQALRNTGPVIAGFTVYESIWSQQARKTGILPMPARKDRVVGGHAVCLVGYDDEKKLFKFRNSWGEDWGDRGYGYMSYSYARRFADDVWEVIL